MTAPGIIFVFGSRAGLHVPRNQASLLAFHEFPIPVKGVIPGGVAVAQGFAGAPGQVVIDLPEPEGQGRDQLPAAPALGGLLGTQISISSMTFHTVPVPLWRTRWPTRGSFSLSRRVKKR